MSDNEKNIETNGLILGIGSQYAGTLLLHNILDQCTDVAMHPMVELHYFDTLYGIRDKKVQKEYAQGIYDYEHDKFLNEYNKTFFNARHETLLHASRILSRRDIEKIDYYDLFEPMKSESEFIGEISPEYMLIEEEDLREMSAYLGRDAKIVLIARHPVDRFLDALRIHVPPKLFSKDRRDFEKELLELIQSTPKWFEMQSAFNHYEEAYERYRRHFDDVLLLSYEGLIDQPESSFAALQEFLDLPLDEDRALDLCDAFVEERPAPLEISSSFRTLLEYKFRDDIAYLEGRFPEIYEEEKVVGADEIERLSQEILKKNTLLFTTIEGLDLEALLEANEDLAEVLDIDVDSEETFRLPEEILREIYLGKRRFHPDYIPFDENLYKKMNLDVRRMIKDTGNDIDYGFDHFCLSGYREIIEEERKWFSALPEEKVSEEGSVETIPLEYQWLVDEEIHPDPFFIYTFVKNIDEEKFYANNRDVYKAVENNAFESLSDYLVHNGIQEIVQGTRFPYGGKPLDQTIMGSADRAYVIDDNRLFVSGWLFADERRKIEKIYFSNGMEGVDILEELSRFDRPDLEGIIGNAYRTAGFYVQIESKLFDSRLPRDYALIVVTEDGLSRRLPLRPEEIDDPKALSRFLLDPLRIDSRLFENLDKNIGPALQTAVLKNPYVIEEEEVTVREFGELPSEPDVSIIVPLYGRIDFVEYQLALFANDPYFAERAELIYVLDDPRLTDELQRLVQGLHPLFGLPFKLVTYTENYGYAIANNIGARYATGRKILLLNSDVMPLEKGWLPQLVETYDTLEDAGALGPKLLFEDGAVQHAGMLFEKSEAFGMWLNEHPGKGLPDMSTEKEVREVPAVTAACLLMDRELYEEVGGLSENYLLGDFEDSDLCLKLVEKGRKNYYLPTVSLCHLERQSQNLFSDTSWKTKVTLFNAWQHHRKWNDLISRLMETSR